MQYSMSLLVLLLSMHVVWSQGYDPAHLLEVYPNDNDPDVLQGRTPLYFALILSFRGSDFDSSGSLAGVKVALDRINNDRRLLPGYTLHYTLTDCKCNVTFALRSFFSEVFRKPTKLAVLGAGCSVTTEITAGITYFFNVSQISCDASSLELRNRLKFPYYFQLLSKSDTIPNNYHEVIKEYGWKKVAILVQNDNLFTVVTDLLKKLLENDGIQYTVKIFDSDKGIEGLGPEPFEDYRIFYISMYEEYARQLLCKAYKRGVYYPKYLLLTLAWYTNSWWRVEENHLNCTADERERVLVSTLSFIHIEYLNEEDHANRTSTTGITGREFMAEEQAFLGQPPLNLTRMDFSPYCYDATWTLAYALNNTLNRVSTDRELNEKLVRKYNVTRPFGLHDFTYENSDMLHIVSQYLSETSFSGITGPVDFDSEGIRSNNKLIVYQYRYKSNDGGMYLDLVKIGNVLPSNSTSENYIFRYKKNENSTTVWNGLVPYDGVPRRKFVTLHPAVTITIVILGCLGICFAAVCLIFNFAFRKTKLIKIASTKLNYMIGIGAIILYVNTFFFVIPTVNPNVVTVLCHLTPWLTAIGYSLCYGTILAKMARVYYIFNNPTAKKKSLKDWMLAVGVGILVAIDLTINVIYIISEALHHDFPAEPFQNKERPFLIEGEREIRTDYYIYICNSTDRNIFFGFLHGYKMVLQILSLFLAFSIRKVKVKGLNDAKYVGAAVYVTSIVQAIIIVATYSLKDFINAFPILFCTGLLVGTTVILILVFVPLMIDLYKDPKGGNISLYSTSMNNSEMSTLKNKIQNLEDEIKEKNDIIGSIQENLHPHSCKNITAEELL